MVRVKQDQTEPESIVEANGFPISDDHNLSIRHILHTADRRVKGQRLDLLHGAAVPQSVETRVRKATHQTLCMVRYFLITVT